MMDSKLIDTPMNLNVKFLPNQGSPLQIQEDIASLLANQIISQSLDLISPFVVSVMSQYLNSPCGIHWDVVV